MTTWPVRLGATGGPQEGLNTRAVDMAQQAVAWEGIQGNRSLGSGRGGLDRVQGCPQLALVWGSLVMQERGGVKKNHGHLSATG